MLAERKVKKKTTCKVRVTVVMKQDNTDCIDHAKCSWSIEEKWRQGSLVRTGC